MNESEFLKYASSGNPIKADSVDHRIMHSMTQRALRLISVIRYPYDSSEELRFLMTDLPGKDNNKLLMVISRTTHSNLHD